MHSILTMEQRENSLSLKFVCDHFRWVNDYPNFDMLKITWNKDFQLFFEGELSWVIEKKYSQATAMKLLQITSNDTKM